MKILEHTSTHLTLQDSAITIWLWRFIGSIFLFMGCVGLFVFIKSFEDVVLNNDIENLLMGTIFMIVSLTGGITSVFFLAKNTVYFNKINGNLTIKSEALFGTKIIEYSINNIAEVIVKKNHNSDGTAYSIFLKLVYPSKKLQLSNTSFSCLRKAEERANIIRHFLNIP
ncbi:MAG TPA: hypothetical protein V6C95_03905 [Coleofasciculaceae cyanobacterium]